MRTDQDTPISVAQQHKSVGAGREQKRAWLALLFTPDWWLRSTSR